MSLFYFRGRSYLLLDKYFLPLRSNFLSLMKSMVIFCQYSILFDAVCEKLISLLFLSGKIFARKSSYDSDSSSLTADKVLVPGSESETSASSTDQLEAPSEASEDPQVLIKHPFEFRCKRNK